VTELSAARPASWLRRAIRGDAPALPIGAVIAVLLGTFMTSFFTRSFAVALADIRGAYGLSVDQGAWLNTVTLAPQLLLAPAIPLAVIVFGARRILLVSGCAFALTMTLTPLASGIPAIFAIHAVDGLLLGCFVPATLATVFANLNPRWWLIALGMYTVRLTLTLHAGVPLTGLYIEGGNWQAIYWQAAASAVLLVALVLVSLPDRPTNTALWHRINKGEIAMFCAGLTLLYAGLDQANRLDWFQSYFVTATIGGGLVLVAAAIVWQFVSPLPFAHPRALARRNVAIPLIVVTFYGTLSVATALLIPNFLATMAQLKAEQQGPALLWVVAVQIVAVPLCIWLIRRTDMRLTLVIGLVAMLLGCWLGSRLDSAWRADDFAATTAVLGVGNAFTFLSLVCLAIANVHRDEIVAMVAYIQVPRVIGPEVAAAVMTTLIRKREGIHSLLLGSYADRPRMASLDIPAHGLAAVIRREAYALAFADGYRLCFLVALACLALCALLQRTPPNPLTARPR
jgi:DHA2 family multidrug resistance protein